ncbi:hypothetical protein MFRU_013g01110 [Monilinia fructicola]|nr:hypothetical protein MFRU_013g01110 [Monilinia fructicola]
MVQKYTTYECGHKVPQLTSVFTKVKGALSIKRALSTKETQPKGTINKLCGQCQRKLESEQLIASMAEIEEEEAQEKGRKTSQAQESPGGKAKDEPWFDKKAEEQKVEIKFWRDRIDKLVLEEALARKRAQEVLED